MLRMSVSALQAEWNLRPSKRRVEHGAEEREEMEGESRVKGNRKEGKGEEKRRKKNKNKTDAKGSEKKNTPGEVSSAT